MPRTLNDIIPPSRRRQMEEEGTLPPGLPPSSSNPQVPPPPPMYPASPLYSAPQPRSRFPYVTALIALVIIALSVGALYFFSGASATIDPSTDTVVVSGNYTATATDGPLPFEVITVQKIGTQAVAGNGTETVTQAAQGTVTISNSQKTAQRLITNTRFETPAGLVFRIHAPAVVPAATDANTPGTTTATLYADSAGDSYNIAATTFTLPGLAGSAAFTAVNAKSTTAMTGGFSGTRPKVDTNVEVTAQTALKAALAPDLASELKAQVPPGYVLLPSATFVTYQDLSHTPDANGSSVDVREQGMATAVVFPSAPFASAIAAQAIATYNKEPVTILDPSKIVLTPAVAGAPAEGAQSYAFSLSGSATVVWNVDPARIASAIAGKTRESAQVVLSSFPEVKRALLVLRPFWASSFPGDPKDIKVTVNPATGS